MRSRFFLSRVGLLTKPICILRRLKNHLPRRFETRSLWRRWIYVFMNSSSHSQSSKPIPAQFFYEMKKCDLLRLLFERDRGSSEYWTRWKNERGDFQAENDSGVLQFYSIHYGWWTVILSATAAHFKRRTMKAKHKSLLSKQSWDRRATNNHL